MVSWRDRWAWHAITDPGQQWKIRKGEVPSRKLAEVVTEGGEPGRGGSHNGTSKPKVSPSWGCSTSDSGKASSGELTQETVSSE